MSVPAGPTSPTPALYAFLGLLVFQRLIELALSARHTRALKARGAVEHGARHFPIFVALHVLYLTALAAEVLDFGARPGRFWPLWLAGFVAAQGLRFWTIHTLGERWTVRVWVLPGAPLVSGGPYRFLRHPNYVAVALEILCAPMIFGAWRTAALFSVLNAAALALRIRVEGRALGLRPAVSARVQR